MNDPIITIGIPTYNNPNGLKQTLDTLLGQTYKNVEVIVSVNPSVDEKVNQNYRHLSEEYRKDPRIHWIPQATNIGSTQNYGFVLNHPNTVGEYFMYAQDDDEWSPGYIQGLISLLEQNPAIPVAMSIVNRRDDTGEIFDSYDMKKISVLNAMRDERVAFVFMGVWRLQKIQEYSKVYSDIAIVAQALLDGGVIINPEETYTKGMRHSKAKEQVATDLFWFFRIYYHLLLGVSIKDWKQVPPVAAINFVWVIRSYAAQILFLLPVDHWLRKSVRKLYRAFG
jgi:glycosyltransferase involved in cell wall biosynthesis